MSGPITAPQTKCRHCASPLTQVFADLGATPISNDYLSAAQVDGPEPYYPLKALVCGSCRLVQLQDFVRSSDLFRADYAYFSSVSSSWLAHCRDYAEQMVRRFDLNLVSPVDGLQNRVHFVVSVLTTAEHAQIEIDLGKCVDGDHDRA